MHEGRLVPWLGFWAVKDQEPGGLRNGVRASRLPWLMCWGGSVTHGVPSAVCPRPLVVSNAKGVDWGGLLPVPGQLTSPVGVDGAGEPRSATAARPFHGRTCDGVRSPMKSQWENGPLQGRTSQVAGVLQAGCPENRPHLCQESRISRGERTASGENLSSGRRHAGWMSENRPHICQESPLSAP